MNRIRGEKTWRVDREVAAWDNGEARALASLVSLLPTAKTVGKDGAGDTPNTTRFSRAIRIAVINTDTELNDAEALLVTHLSRIENATVLERSELRRLAGERTLGTGAFGAVSAAGNIRLGRLLGVRDCGASCRPCGVCGI